MKTKLLMSVVMVLAAVSHVDARDTGSTGNGETHSNEQPSLGVNHIIALQGLYPPRNITEGDGSASMLGGMEPYIGEVSLFGGNFAPRGWAFTDGQLLSINSNQSLFSILGTTYGGDGRTTFALPDLRGRTAIHTGTGPGLTNRKLGDKGGGQKVTVTQNQMPSHNHPPGWLNDVTLNAGGGQDHQNMQPYLALSSVIALQGLYPSSNITEGEGSAETLIGGDPFIAEIGWFAGNFAPRNSAFSSGQLLSISSNTALFSLVGTTYGGDGRTTFGLPDLRGRAAIGARRGLGLTNRRLGERVGEESLALTVGQMPSHVHSLPPSGFTTGSEGGGQPHTEMQPSLALNYIIALQGVFPSRNIVGEEDTADALLGAQPFIGEVSLFGGNFAPRDWAFCDGQLLSINLNQALFSLLGTTYGGDGRTTFALPDLRGRTPVHPGTGPGLKNVRLGQVFGNEELTMNGLPAHTHEVTAIDIPGDANRNGFVDEFDLAVLLGNWESDPLIISTWELGNFTEGTLGDTDVNDVDLAVLLGNWTGPPPPAGASVPEPATLALMALGGLAVMRRRRRPVDA